MRRQSPRRAPASIRQSGKLLIEAKAALPHGKWLPWLREIDISPRTAQRYMQLAQVPADKYDTVAHFGIKRALVAIAKQQCHVELITSAFRKIVESRIETGRRIIAAKGGLPHEEFTAMVEEDLPFGSGEAQMLMAVAQHPVVSNPKHASHLPICLEALYELMRLPTPTLEAKIADKTINPFMERKHALALKREVAR
jgi:hypothetical protein